MTAMQLLVVPKSIPKTFAITFSPSEAVVHTTVPHRFSFFFALVYAIAVPKSKQSKIRFLCHII
jgi:hypothetical protein